MAAMHDSKLFAADVPPGGIGSQDQGGGLWMELMEWLTVLFCIIEILYGINHCRLLDGMNDYHASCLNFTNLTHHAAVYNMFGMIQLWGYGL